MVGVVDYQKQKQSRKSWNSDNAISYYGYGDGYKHPGGLSEGGGFRQGETV